MNLDTLIDAWATAIAGSTAIASWCTTNGYSSVTVFKTTDLEALPGVESYPVVALNMGRKFSGIGQDNEELAVAVGIGVYDEADPQITGSVVELLGRKRCEELRRLVVTEIAAAEMDGGYVALVEVEHEPVDISFFYLCGMEITVVRPYQFRDSRLL